MNIVIVGGGKEVDFLVRSLLSKKHSITIINEDEHDCKELAHEHDVQVILGDASKVYVLEDAGIQAADLMIALTSTDAVNLVICQIAKKQFAVRRVFAVVNNPRNVSVFKLLGVDTAISATYMLAHVIEQMASVREIINYMPMEDGKIQLIEFSVSPEHKVCGKRLHEIAFPSNAIIGCIVRNGNFSIPNGQSEILAGDKLTILAATDSQKMVLDALIGRGSK